MTAATTFASISLINMLIGPLNAFPWALNGIIEAYISIKRVQSYLDVGEQRNYTKIVYFNFEKNNTLNTVCCFQLPDVDLHKYYSPMEAQTPNDDESNTRPIVISLKNASFCYTNINSIGSNDENSDNTQNFTLSPINGDIKKVSEI